MVRRVKRVGACVKSRVRKRMTRKQVIRVVRTCSKGGKMRRHRKHRRHRRHRR